MDSYDYSYNTYDSSYSSADAGVALAAIMGFLLIYFLFVVAMYVVMAIFLGKIFKKAGVPSWVAWVPVYNNWKMLEIGGKPGWWALLAFVPVVNIVSIVFMIIAMFNIGKKLGKEDWFILVAIFLSPIWIIWLGADSSVWDESKGAPRVDTPTVPPTPTAAPVAAVPTQQIVAPTEPQAPVVQSQQPEAPVDEQQPPQTPPTTPPTNPIV